MVDSDHGNFSAAVQDHARNPRNLGPLPMFNGHAVISGGCGDLMEFWVFIRGGEVVRAAFDTNGCGSSLACGSMATCLAERKPMLKAMLIGQNDILNALGGLPEKHQHCALLAANALRAACEDHQLHGKWRMK